MPFKRPLEDALSLRPSTNLSTAIKYEPCARCPCAHEEHGTVQACMLLELLLDVGDTAQHAHALEGGSGRRGIGGRKKEEWETSM